MKHKIDLMDNEYMQYNMNRRRLNHNIQKHILGFDSNTKQMQALGQQMPHNVDQQIHIRFMKKKIKNRNCFQQTKMRDGDCEKLRNCMYYQGYCMCHQS